MNILAKRTRDLHADYIEKEAEVERLREELTPEITTFQNGTYTTKMRALIYRLLSRNIAHEQLAGTIQDILDFAGRKATQLPTPKTIGAMNLERLALAQTQIGVSQLTERTNH